VGTMRTFLATMLAVSSLALARPPAGQTQVVVVMKMASCGVCAAQMRRLAEADLGAPVMGITHSPRPEAQRVAAATGVPTYSHAEGIRSMGLWLDDRGLAMPAVVVYDRCGEEAGRIVGRRPGADVTEAVQQLVREADAADCSKAVS